LWSNTRASESARLKREKCETSWESEIQDPGRRRRQRTELQQKRIFTS
jgi:hypothetical protein